MLTPHSLNISPAQVKKLLKGGAISVKPSHFVEGGGFKFMAMPQSARRIATSLRKNKGLRLALKQGEELLDKEGGKINLGKAFKSIGKALGSKQARNIYREIGKEALPVVKKTLKSALPAVGAAVSAYTGNPMLGALVSKAGDTGLDVGFKQIDKVAGIKRGKKNIKAIDDVSRMLKGPTAIDEVSGLMKGPTAIDDVAEMVKKPTTRPRRVVRQTNEELADELMRELNPSVSPTEADLDNILNETELAYTGRGIRVRKTRRGIKIGGACCDGMGGSGIYPAGKYGNGLKTGLRHIAVAEPPSRIIQTGSPYLSYNSPAQNPYIGASPQLDNKIIGRVGGSFLPA